MKETLRDRSTALFKHVVHIRMAGWALTALVLPAVVAPVAPWQLDVGVYKMSLTAPVALAGYWIDRGAFPYARLDRHFKPHRDGQETTFTAIHGGSTLPST